VPVTIRLCLLGCALIAALALSACGGGGDGGSGGGTDRTRTAAESSPSAQPTTGAASGIPGKECQGQVGGFIGSMDALRRRLAVGLAYQQYVHEVEGVRAAYRRIPAARLALDCLNGVGAPGERSFNVYIGAANAWGECVGEAGCEAATVEPVLQRKWRVASRFLSQAHRGLRDLGAG
jgi:hypothetical protein